MYEVILDIQQWGGGLALALPAALVEEAHLSAEQSVRLVVEEERITITPLNRSGMSLEDRLKQFNPVRHQGEVMMGDRFRSDHTTDLIH